MNSRPDPSTAADLEQALQRLICPAVPQDKDKNAPLIETIFSDRRAIDVIDCLQKSDAQAFIDAIDGVRHHTIFPVNELIHVYFHPPHFAG